MRRIKHALKLLGTCDNRRDANSVAILISVVYSVINVVVAGKRMCLKLKASFLQWESQQLFYMYCEVCRVTFAAELNLSSFHLGMKHPGEGGCSRSIWNGFQET